jgi:hypothetical protein
MAPFWSYPIKRTTVWKNFGSFNFRAATRNFPLANFLSEGIVLDDRVTKDHNALSCDFWEQNAVPFSDKLMIITKKMIVKIELCKKVYILCEIFITIGSNDFTKF